MSSHHATCDRDCGPFGSCLVDTSPCVAEGGGNHCPPSQTCLCLQGFGGPDCSSRVNDCRSTATTVKKTTNATSLDVNFCYNGGRCETYTYDDSVLVGTRCNCHFAVGEAGQRPGEAIQHWQHQCEFPTQQSCEEGVKVSSYAYCVNGGMCQSIVASGSPHPFCTCSKRFAGRHCQFLASDIPSEEVQYVVRSTTTNGHPVGPSGSGGNEVEVDTDASVRTNVAIVFMIVVSTVLLFAGIYASRRRKRRFRMAQISLVTDVTLDEIVFEKDVEVRSPRDGEFDLSCSIQQRMEGESQYRDDITETETKIV